MKVASNVNNFKQRKLVMQKFWFGHTLCQSVMKTHGLYLMPKYQSEMLWERVKNSSIKKTPLG